VRQLWILVIAVSLLGIAAHVIAGWMSRLLERMEQREAGGGGK